MALVLMGYNEDMHGPIDDAVEISNESYVIWVDPAPGTKYVIEKLKFPAELCIKVRGKEEYYVGELIFAKPFLDFNPKIFTEDAKHRPATWRSVFGGEGEAALFVSNLKRASSRPLELRDTVARSWAVLVKEV